MSASGWPCLLVQGSSPEDRPLSHPRPQLHPQQQHPMARGGGGQGWLVPRPSWLQGRLDSEPPPPGVCWGWEATCLSLLRPPPCKHLLRQRGVQAEIFHMKPGDRHGWSHQHGRRMDGGLGLLDQVGAQTLKEAPGRVRGKRRGRRGGTPGHTPRPAEPPGRWRCPREAACGEALTGPGPLGAQESSTAPVAHAPLPRPDGTQGQGHRHPPSAQGLSKNQSIRRALTVPAPAKPAPGTATPAPGKGTISPALYPGS